MTATQQISAMLNELMGSGRNAQIGESRLLLFDEASVCKLFLAGYCPHDLFVNTKADMGPCDYVHDDELKRAYQQSDRFEKLGYELKFYKTLCRINSDIKKKIARNEKRLTITQPGTSADDPANEKHKEQLVTLENDIENLIKQSNAAGEEGEVAKAMEFSERADRLKTELNKVRCLIFGGEGMTGKPLEVCQVCGCLMIIGDVQQRLDDHFSGRQHVGYAKIAASIEELKERIDELEEKERRYNDEHDGYKPDDRERPRRYRDDRRDYRYRDLDRPPRSRSRSPRSRDYRDRRDHRDYRNRDRYYDGHRRNGRNYDRRDRDDHEDRDYRRDYRNRP